MRRYRGGHRRLGESTSTWRAMGTDPHVVNRNAAAGSPSAHDDCATGSSALRAPKRRSNAPVERSTCTQAEAKRAGRSLSINPRGDDRPGRSVWVDLPPRENCKTLEPYTCHRRGRTGCVADLIVLANEWRRL